MRFACAVVLKVGASAMPAGPARPMLPANVPATAVSWRRPAPAFTNEPAPSSELNRVM